MPSNKTVLSKKSFSNYPNLSNFLSGNLDDVGILGDGLDMKYELVLSDKMKVNLSIFQVLCLYGKHGNLKLFQLDKMEIKKAIQANEGFSILLCAQNGHTDTIKHLCEYLTREEIKQVVKARDYGSIRLAAENGHTDTIKGLCEYLTREEIKQVVKKLAYYSIRMSAKNGHTDTIKGLCEYLTREEIKQAVKARDYGSIRLAAENGHTDTIKHLCEYLTREEIKQVVKADNYSLIRLVSRYGHTDTLKHLLSTYLTKKEITQMVKADNYNLIRLVSRYGHTDTIKHLSSYLTREETIEAIKADDYYSVRMASKYGHTNTAHYLLENETVFGYMEKHDMEYGKKLIYPFVDSKLEKLAQEKEAFEQTNPNRVFNLNEERAQFCFYLLRNLIRRGVDRDYGDENREAEELGNALRFLLSIPSVRLLCHQRITVDEDSPGQENELLRLALNLNNQVAVQLLMQLPEVRQLAEQNNYYLNEVRGGLSLREIAQDNESSMVSLSPTEQQMLDIARQTYQEYIKGQGGEEAVFESLKRDLKQLYESNPACIELINSDNKRETIELPFEWNELQVLRTALTNTQYQKALEAYYKHPVHTAYRYLSKPNYWMANNASFVYVMHDQQGRRTDLRYATFEEYKSLITLFYTAANDDKTPAIDGYTLEGRKDLFIKQLALIGRAHNWDGGMDDYKMGDKPSCYSGVKRRLFQSVLGHGLFKVITKDIIIQALNEQIRGYFKQVITDKNCVNIKKAYDGLVTLEGDMNKHLKTLRSIDIPEITKHHMVEKVCQQLSFAYKNQFDDKKLLFLGIIERYFKNARIAGCDFCGLQGPIRLEEILKDRIKQRLQEKQLNIFKRSSSLFKELAWQMKVNELSECRHQSNKNQRAYDKRR